MKIIPRFAGKMSHILRWNVFVQWKSHRILFPFYWTDEIGDRYTTKLCPPPTMLWEVANLNVNIQNIEVARYKPQFSI